MSIKSKNIQDQMTNTIISIADEIINQAKFDKTVQGTVTAINGKLATVTIDNNANNTCNILDGININLGDVVLVKRIQNNSNNKLITGKIGTVGTGIGTLPNVLNAEFYSGDSRSFIINVVDQNNIIVSLVGAIITWGLTLNGTTVLSKSIGSGITVSNPTGGQFIVSLLSNETINLNGNYQHLARVTTTDGSSSIVLTGTISVETSPV